MGGNVQNGPIAAEFDLCRCSLADQRFFLHALDLLVEQIHLAAPVVAAAKPGEVHRKGRVLPAAGEPGAVVDEAQGAQGLDQRQLAAVKGAELLVAVQQGGQLHRLLASVTGQQHPQVLHGGAHAGVVQVYEMRATVAGLVQRGPEDVAGVAIAVQAQHSGIFQAKLAFRPMDTSGSSYQFQSAVAGLAPGGLHVQRDQVLSQQPVARFLAKAGPIQRGAVDKGPRRAHGVDAGQEAADPFQHLEVVQLRPAPAAPGADGEGECAVLVQGLAVQHQRPHGRDFSGHQLGGEGVFFQDLRVAPAAGAVELGDHFLAVFQHHLIDPVFVGGQGGEPAIAIQADAREGVEHAVGRQGGEGVGGRGGVGVVHVRDCGPVLGRIPPAAFSAP